jgi:hypothetical protein
MAAAKSKAARKPAGKRKPAAKREPIDTGTNQAVRPSQRARHLVHARCGRASATAAIGDSARAWGAIWCIFIRDNKIERGVSPAPG